MSVDKAPLQPMAARQELDEILAQIPREPGVYLMKGAQGEILYIGKALSLRNRVRSYFRGTSDERPSVHFLRKKVYEIETLITPSEKAALLLENTLIKKHRPRYNVHLRDDKTFLGLRLSIQDPVPRLSIVRKPKKDDAEYFGPFHSSSALRQVFRLLQKTFGVRICEDTFFRNRTRPCMEYEIGRCLGPCVAGIVSEEAYDRAVQETRQFLRGHADAIVERLKEKIEVLAGQDQFEEAIRYRDQLEAIQTTLQAQVVASHRREDDQDVFGIHRQGEACEIYILFVRKGVVVGGQGYFLDPVLGTEAEILSSVLVQRYASEEKAFALPGEILLPLALDQMTFLTETLNDWVQKSRTQQRPMKQRYVRLHVPKRGERHKLVLMAQRNARLQFERRMKEAVKREKSLAELARKLHLPRIPRRVECFDISNFQGDFAVGSMVVFVDGEAQKGAYRHFKIKSVAGMNDFDMLKEVMTRRFRRKEGIRPDLLVVDGGKGQLRIAKEVMATLGLEGISLAAMAKARTLPDEKGVTLERLFIPGRSNAITFRRGSWALFFLENLRNEAHRFAITHYRKLHKKALTGSILDQVPGIGPAKRKKLLTVFGSVKALKGIRTEELQRVAGISRATAEKIQRLVEAVPEVPVGEPANGVEGRADRAENHPNRKGMPGE